MSKVHPNFPTLTLPTKNRYACTKCNKPCILVGERCQIAKVRIAMDCSFKVAYALLTQLDPDHDADVLTQQKYFAWRQAGEPMPQDYQI